MTNHFDLVRKFCEQSKWLLTFKGVDVDPDFSILIGFAHAGGSCANLRALAANLPHSIGMVAVELPGHGGRTMESAWTDLSRISRGAASALVGLLGLLKQLSETVPVFVFGHSMGSLVAYRTTWELIHMQATNADLRDHIVPIRGLIVSGRHPPLHSSLPGPRIHEISDTKKMLEALVTRYDDSALRQFLDTGDSALQFIEPFLPALRADLEMVETFDWAHFSADFGDDDHDDGDGPGQAHGSTVEQNNGANVPQKFVLNIPILAVAGTKDACIDQEKFNDWGKFTSQEFTMRRAPDGPHQYYLQNGSPGQKLLVEQITNFIVKFK